MAVSAIIVTIEWKVPISLTDTVIIGDTIIWSWADTAPHDLTFLTYPAGFTSIATNGVEGLMIPTTPVRGPVNVSFHPSLPGEYTYRYSVHSSMTGTLTVLDKHCSRKCSVHSSMTGTLTVLGPDVGNMTLGGATITSSTPVPLPSPPSSSKTFPTTIAVAGGIAAAAIIIEALALALLRWKRQRSRRRPSARPLDSDGKAFDPTQAPTLPARGSSGPVSRGLLDNWSDSGRQPGPVLSDSYLEERTPKPQPTQLGMTQRPPKPELQEQYTLRQLQAATNHFSEASVIGGGSFGVVCEGVLADGSVVAVKRLRKRFGIRQSEEKLWRTEVDALGKMRQKNLVSLLGVCLEGDERLLVFEFFPRGSLNRRLHEPREEEPVLTWAERMCIIRGICRGLSYLHHDLRPPMLHRDINAANVLLTDEEPLEACIADFGLAHFVQDVGTNTSTMVKGTVPYMAPEYLHGGARFLSPKCDVYSLESSSWK
ncbi:hypothetical protein KFL_003710060 [Klebsormidium nitens]|uniref:Protein kinase domain-containing protein n=1 Tax=Klebsormidium nitens TaxID=105231 RepID=A0A1Y1I9T8_KLENI|nr:hypothetical protein KFL_003710060 [Klebsormidium nitens]|eukprot:GAQ87700.1 hypothetical protein KFL_003710060 [Klebsormidium nitens]